MRRAADASGEIPTCLRIRLPVVCRNDVVRECLGALPNEGCGLLLGDRDGPAATVFEIWPAANLRASAERYEIAPEAVLAADRAARAAGRILLGAWHSHPGGRAAPSATDRAEAWPDWCYLIVGLADPETPEIRAWRLLDDDFVEDLLEIE